MINKIIKSEIFVFALIILPVFAVYFFTLPRTITLEDDGLFLMASYFSGISHPPGYPLYSIISYFFSLLPLDPYPLKIHAMSAFFASCTCLMLGVFVKRLGLSWLFAVLAALSFAFSKAYWSQAIIAEVYTLNSFLIMTLFVMAVSLKEDCFAADKKNNTRGNNSNDSCINFSLLCAGAFLYGLSLTVHIPLVVLSTPSLLFLLYPYRFCILKNILTIFLLFLLGLLPYAWMVWRSNTGVVINFYGEIKSIADLIFIFSREGYVEVDISTTSGLSDKINYLLFLLSEIYQQFTWVGFLFVVMGFISQWWNWSARVCLSLLILFLNNSFFFLLVLYFDYDFLSRSVFSVYPLLAYLVMSIWLAMGLSFVCQIVERLFSFNKYSVLVPFSIGFLIVILIFTKNLSVNNRSKYNWANEYAFTLLNSLPKNTNLFVSGDIHTFTLGYMKHVEKIRPDIDIFNLQGLIFSNRLFHPVKTSENEKLRILEEFVNESARPVCTSDAINSASAHRDYWLFSCFSKEKNNKYEVKLNAQLLAYFEKIVTDKSQTDPWTIHHQQQLIKKMGVTLGKMFVNNISNDGRHHEDMVSLIINDYFGALGYLEGINSYMPTPKDINEMIRVIKQVNYIPELSKKHDKASFYKIRGDVSVLAGNIKNAINEYQSSIDIWPDIKNTSIKKLLDLYSKENLRTEYTELKLQFGL